jgi:hypothetical protein
MVYIDDYENIVSLKNLIYIFILIIHDSCF